MRGTLAGGERHRADPTLRRWFAGYHGAAGRTAPPVLRSPLEHRTFRRPYRQAQRSPRRFRNAAADPSGAARRKDPGTNRHLPTGIDRAAGSMAGIPRLVPRRHLPPRARAPRRPRAPSNLAVLTTETRAPAGNAGEGTRGMTVGTGGVRPGPRSPHRMERRRGLCGGRSVCRCCLSYAAFNPQPTRLTNQIRRRGGDAPRVGQACRTRSERAGSRCRQRNASTTTAPLAYRRTSPPRPVTTITRPSPATAAAMKTTPPAIEPKMSWRLESEPRPGTLNRARKARTDR